MLTMILGGLKVAGLFLRKNWKIALLIAVVFGGFFLHRDAVNAFGDRRYAEGKAVVVKGLKDALAEQQKKNLELERDAATALADFAKDRAEMAEKRINKETVIREKTIQYLDSEEYGQCAISQDILDERNRIRALGPQE